MHGVLLRQVLHLQEVRFFRVLARIATHLTKTSRKMRRVPECIGCTAKNECLCYKYALQERCSFNPTLFFEDCKCAMCDFREGNDIVRRTTFLASLQNSPADLTAGRGGAERPGLRLHLRRVRLPLLRRVPRRDRLRDADDRLQGHPAVLLPRLSLRAPVRR